MTHAQQVQEHTTNRFRQQAPSFKVGDKVWLNLINIRTTRTSKKLDTKHAKFTITEVIGSHSYRLDTLLGIHNVFHSRLLRPASSDPLPSQVRKDSQPQPQLVSGEEEYEIDDIVDERTTRRGRAQIKQLLVRWIGYTRPT
jgi:hypothetical protein